MVRGTIAAIALSLGALQAPTPNQHVVGNVAIVVPPPEGFEDATSNAEFRSRFPPEPNVNVLAVYLPSAVAKTLKPGQGATSYALAAGLSLLDVTQEEFDRMAQRLGGVPPSADQTQRLTEAAKQKGIAIAAPVNLGAFVRTPQSVAILMLTGVKTADESFNSLSTNGVVRIKGRLVRLQAARRFDGEIDRAAAEDLMKAWIRRVIAANP